MFVGMSIEISEDELRELEKKFFNLNIKRYKPPMAQAIGILNNEMKQYPPPPPNSTYDRTGLLGRNWSKRVYVTGIDVVGEARNNTSYGQFVQNAPTIATIHAGRWTTIQEAQRNNEDEILEIFKDWTDTLLK